jgi:gentisate 1,2-dioxygenase
MPDAAPYTGLRYDEMPSLWDGFANLVRPGLGLSAFGANVMNLPPDYETKAHDESESGQEELYVALAGSGAVVVGDERVALDPECAVRVGPGTPRVLASGPDGLRVLIIGGVPGQAYVAPEWSSGG